MSAVKDLMIDDRVIGIEDLNVRFHSQKGSLVGAFSRSEVGE